jgi:hypothetical protein
MLNNNQAEDIMRALALLVALLIGLTAPLAPRTMSPRPRA